MKKVNLAIGLAIISCTLLIVQCKKKDSIFESQTKNGGEINNTPPTPATKIDIEKQLQWIARGYAEVHNTFTPFLFNEMNTYLGGNDFYAATHDDLEPSINTSVGMLLEPEIFSSINRISILSGYNRGYFYGFNYDNCDWKTCIRIVDTPVLSNPVVFSYESVSGSDSCWGYFWNSGLDSVLLTSNNYDLYYVFQIFAESDCQMSGPNVSGCNLNGVCEDLQGENEENCEDCRGAKNVNEKTLKVVWVRINEDISRFEEAWGQGKYELGWEYCIADGIVGITHNYRDGEEAKLYNKWKRKEVPINRNSRKGLKGTVTSKQFKPDPTTATKMAILYDRFDYTTDEIYLSFWEDDKYGNETTTRIQTSPNPIQNNINFPLGGSPAGFSQDWYKRTNGGTFDEGGFNPGGIIYVPDNSTWTPEVIGGKNCMVIEATTPGNNEITVKFAYEL